jgi:hypothetical protein
MIHSTFTDPLYALGMLRHVVGGRPDTSTSRPAHHRSVPRRAALTSALVLWLVASALAAAAPPHVYILLIDGLDASRMTEALTPTLWALAHDPKHGTYYPAGRSVLPTVTLTNHAAVMTGATTRAHGITGNSLWERVPGGTAVPSEQSSLLEAETLFTVIEKDHPRLVTAAIFGKSHLVGLFSDAAGQHRPDILWGDPQSETEPFDERVGYGSDARTMDEALRTIAASDPALMFVALPDVDRTSHVAGPDSNEARKALLEADRQVRRLVKFLQSRERWERTVMMITADHGMASVAPNPDAGRPYPLLFFGRVLARAGIQDVMTSSAGTLETIALPGAAPTALDAAHGALLARIRALALAEPEIAEAWYRLPNPADGGERYTVARAHPEWHADHPRMGELVLVARPGYAFVDPFSAHAAGLSGMHGGPDTMHIPIIVTGGDPRLRAQVVPVDGPIPQASNPDVGATAAALLGVRRTRLVNGGAIPAELAGRVLREAFVGE